MMVRDHSAANDRLKALATQRNVTLPDSVSSKHKKMMETLNKKSGKEFDRFYINEMVKDHQEDVKAFEQAANKVSDLEVKAFINNTLPTLKTHLDSAKAIQKRVK
jgi:putative membrane protein